MRLLTSLLLCVALAGAAVVQVEFKDAVRKSNYSDVCETTAIVVDGVNATTARTRCAAATLTFYERGVFVVYVRFPVDQSLVRSSAAAVNVTALLRDRDFFDFAEGEVTLITDMHNAYEVVRILFTVQVVLFLLADTIGFVKL